MRTQRALIVTASAALCAWPLQAMAQTEGGFTLEAAPEKPPVVITTSSAELGLGWVSEDSFKFGEYTGLEDEGPFVIGNIDFLWRSPYDGTSTEYWEFSASNLGVASRSVHFEAGQQGRFGVFLDYRGLPRFQTDDATTPYLGSGSDFLTLPDSWVPAANTPASGDPGMTELDNVQNPVRLKTRRDRYGGGFTYQLDKEFSFGASYSREDKDGLESIAGIFASSGGTPRAAILPKPIDYTTQDANVFLAYNGDRLQAELSYHLSQFDNDTPTLSWQNAYNAIAGWDPDQSFANGGFGTMALEPDNTAHSVSLSMGYTLDPTTRIAGNLSYTKMLQDEDFLPYSTTGFGADGILFGPLPRDSLEGEVTRIHGAVSVAKQFTPDLSLDAQYTFDGRDNDTPRDIFCVVHSDSTNQNPDCDFANPDATFETTDGRINRPYSRQQHNFNVDGTYRVLPDTKVTLGYGFEAIDREFTEVDNTYEHTGSVKVASSPFSFASGWLKYSFSDRSGSDYIGNEPVLASHTAETILAEGGAEGFWEANAYARKYYIADRRRHRLTGAVNLMPMDEINIGLMGNIDLQNYHETLIGLTERNYYSATIDANYVPNEALSFYSFFTYDRMNNDQIGFETRSTITPDIPFADLNPAGFWTVDTRDRGYTVGVGADWTVIPDLLKLGADYAFSYTNTEYEFSGDPSLGAEPVPDVTSTLHSVGARAEITIAEGATLNLFYRYEMFDNDDFALETGTSLPAVITLGTQSLDYSVHLVGLSLRYAF